MNTRKIFSTAMLLSLSMNAFAVTPTCTMTIDSVKALGSGVADQVALVHAKTMTNGFEQQIYMILQPDANVSNVMKAAYFNDRKFDLTVKSDACSTTADMPFGINALYSFKLSK